MDLVPGSWLLMTRGVLRVALVALVATFFVVVGAHGRYATQLPGAVPAIGMHLPPAPTETGADAPHVLDAPAVRLGDPQARHRQARRADATRKAPRGAPVELHAAALHGAAGAIAIAARDRERTALLPAPASRPAAPPGPRGPPSIG